MTDGIRVFIPDLSEKEYLSLIHSDEKNFDFVPLSQKTNEMQEFINFKNKLKYRTFNQTTDIETLKYLSQVQENGLFIQNIPPEKLTTKICLAAINQNPQAFAFLPESAKTFKIYQKIVNKCKNGITQVPPVFRTPMFLKETILSNPHSFEFFTEEEKTVELCEYAVSISYLCMRWVSEEKRTPEFWAEYYWSLARNSMWCEFIERQFAEETKIRMIKRHPQLMWDFHDGAKTSKMSFEFFKTHIDFRTQTPVHFISSNFIF